MTCFQKTICFDFACVLLRRRLLGPRPNEDQHESPGVKTIIRRLRRLEDRLGPPVETEFSRCLRARIEAGRRRLAESWPQDGRMHDAGGAGAPGPLRSKRGANPSPRTREGTASGRIEADNVRQRQPFSARGAFREQADSSGVIPHDEEFDCPASQSIASVA